VVVCRLGAIIQRQFWRSIRAGLSTEAASANLGVDRKAGQRWFRKAGGVPPLSLVEPVKTRSLNITEREKILAGINQDLCIQAIAASIGQAPSTVSRELAQHMRHKYIRVPGRPGRRHTRDWDYSPLLAQRRADAAAARSKVAKLAENLRLRQEVHYRLEEEHSPEQITARLRVDFPDEPKMRVSPETIYQSPYVQGMGALRRDLHVRLRTGRALRKPRRRRSKRRGRIPGMANISERPPEVEDRAVPGHWEGDLVVGKNSGSAIGTLVERMTGFVMLLHLPDNHGADTVQDAMAIAMSQLPAVLKKTLTRAKSCPTTSRSPRPPIWTSTSATRTHPGKRQQRAHPRAATPVLPQGQRPVGLRARRPRPRRVETEQPPRKRLAWKTPAEALNELLSEPLNPPRVALTG
jgi:IS30 family transposase